MKYHLTELDPAFEKSVRETAPGMAHWAGSGPQGKTCAGCQHFGTIYPDSTARPKMDRCKKYFKMMDGKIGGKLDKNTPACKYYETTL